MGDLSNYFDRSEFRCRDDCGFDTIDYETLVVLEKTREHFNAPVIINSPCRCEIHNRAVGGAVESQHLRARAVDFVVQGVSPAAVQAYLIQTYPGKYGIGSYATFTHLDTRTNGPARW